MRVRQPVRTVLGMVPLLAMLIPLSANAQAAAPAERRTPQDSLEKSVRDLADQVKRLNATIGELRAEVSDSRQETRELREQLRRAMAKISERAGESSPGRKGASPGPPVEAGVAPPARGAQKSASARLEELEENQALLKSMMDVQEQSKVESASKYRMRLSGIVLLNVFGNRGTVDNLDVPNLALPRGPLDTGGSFGATARQSELGFEAYGPAFAGARASANLQLDLFGGFTDTANGVTSDIARLRTATVRMDWARTSVVVGQDAPFFSPLSPTSIASLGYPEFSYSGNLWTWTPQVRVEHTLNVNSSNRILLQGGFLDPLSGQGPSGEPERTPQAGEQSRQPGYAMRLAWSHGEPENPASLGFGGYYSRQNYGAGRTEDAWTSTADWSLPLGKVWSWSGEFYRGRALGGLGGAQDRSVLFSGPRTDPNSTLVGLNTVGGWTQLKFKASEALEFNTAYGEDNPFARDLRYFSTPAGYEYASISRNQSEVVNVIYRPRTDLMFSLEFRHINTRDTTGQKETANHVNMGVGILF